MYVLLVGGELEENLGLRYLASSLERAGHTVGFAGFDGHEDEAAILGACRAADLVGLSMSFQRRALEFVDLAGLIRRAGFGGHITCGGHFPTFAYREVLDRCEAIDTVVRHEGELTLVELCAAVKQGGGPEALSRVPGIAYRLDDGSVTATEARPLVADLDSLPPPKRVDRAQVHLGIPATFVLGSRGCNGHCTFCCIQSFVRDAGGPRYRQRGIEQLAEEMSQLRHEQGARMFVFHDDDFLTRDHEHDRARLSALRDGLRRRDVDDIALVLKIRPDDIDEAVFDVLQEIGLLRVYLGVEAGSTQGLRTLARGMDIEANRRGLAFLRSRQIYTCFNMLIFDPETTVSSLRESLDLLREYPEVPMNFCRAEVYVGTPLMRKLDRQSRLLGDVFGWDYEIADPAAELVFRVFAEAFMDRNFRSDGLMNSSIGLGYHLYLLRHFHPPAFSEQLRTVAEQRIARVNLDSIDRMTQIIDFACGPQAGDPQALSAFTRQITAEVSAANATLEREVAEVSRLITEAAHRGRSPSRPMWRSVAAATLALSPLACDPHTPPITPGDPPPPPPPTQDAGVDTGATSASDAGGQLPHADPAPPPVTPTGTPKADPAPPPTVHKDPAPPPTVHEDPAPPPMIHRDPAPPPHKK